MNFRTGGYVRTWDSPIGGRDEDMDDLLTRPGPRPPGALAPPAPGAPPSSRGPREGAGPWRRLVRATGETGRRWAGSRRFDLLLVVLLMALSLGLRWRTLWTSYWGDEAIAIGIAAHPIGSLPRYLANDGSPPLFYVMLHFWLRLFGRSEPATHALSMVAAVLAIPAAWWSGDKLFGRRAARYAAALMATCAYLDYYSTETRMYSWLVLAAILAVACFVLAYRGAGRVYWATAVLLMVAVLYLQYYGLYLLAATVIVGAVAALRSGARDRLKATLVYLALCAAAFVPWAPQFVYQLRNTGAPWAPKPSFLDFFGDSFNALASAAWATIIVAIAVAVLMPRRGTRAAGPLDGGGSSTPLDGDGSGTTVARHAAAPRPAGPGPSALALATAIPLVTLVLAWCGSQIVNSWNPRYLGIAAVPALVPLGAGLARARWGSVVLWATVAALAGTAVPMVVDRSVTVETSKSDAAYLLDHLRPGLRPGALVISTQVTDTPVLALDLGERYRYATPFGLLKDPLVVDWSDISRRLQGADAATNLAPLLSKLPVGGQVLVVNPTSWGGSETPEAYAGPVEAEAIAANQAVLDDPQLQPITTEDVPTYANPLYPMQASLFVKTSSGHSQHERRGRDLNPRTRFTSSTH
jgi:mannosyltransferase